MQTLCEVLLSEALSPDRPEVGNEHNVTTSSLCNVTATHTLLRKPWNLACIQYIRAGQLGKCLNVCFFCTQKPAIHSPFIRLEPFLLQIKACIMSCTRICFHVSHSVRNLMTGRCSRMSTTRSLTCRLYRERWGGWLHGGRATSAKARMIIYLIGTITLRELKKYRIDSFVYVIVITATRYDDWP